MEPWSTRLFEDLASVNAVLRFAAKESSAILSGPQRCNAGSSPLHMRERLYFPTKAWARRLTWHLGRTIGTLDSLGRRCERSHALDWRTEWPTCRSCRDQKAYGTGCRTRLRAFLGNREEAEDEQVEETLLLYTLYRLVFVTRDPGDCAGPRCYTDPNARPSLERYPSFETPAPIRYNATVTLRLGTRIPAERIERRLVVDLALARTSATRDGDVLLLLRCHRQHRNKMSFEDMV